MNTAKPQTTSTKSVFARIFDLLFTVLIVGAIIVTGAHLVNVAITYGAAHERDATPIYAETMKLVRQDLHDASTLFEEIANKRLQGISAMAEITEANRRIPKLINSIDALDNLTPLTRKLTAEEVTLESQVEAAIKRLGQAIARLSADNRVIIKRRLQSI